MKTKKILIVDDSALFRSHVREILAEEPDVEIVGEARDGWEAIERAKALGPDIVLLDVRLPRLNGIEVTQRLKKELPKLKIIILTIHNLLEYRKAAKNRGADAFVLKVNMDKELVPAIRRIINSPKK